MRTRWIFVVLPGFRETSCSICSADTRIHRYHVHFFVNPQTTNLLQLAVGLVIDLGLKRTARAYRQERLENAIARSAHGEHANSELRTSEQRRALLGCFYLTTMYAASVSTILFG